MNKTVSMAGVLALAAATAFAQSSTTTSGQSGQSGSSTSGQSTTGSDQKKGEHSGHGMTPSDSSSTQSSSMSGSGSLAASDRRFIETAARGGMAEVELGRLAAEKAQSPEVKAFGQMMVDDHSKANDELKTLASQKGVTLPTDTDAAHKATKDRLDKLSGDQFDQAFMKEMLKDHKKDVAEFKRAAKTGKDDDVKEWAAKKVPTLEQHLQHAQQASNMNAAGGTSATSTTGSKKKSGSSSGSGPDQP
jgi:putative membrane protein